MSTRPTRPISTPLANIRLAMGLFPLIASVVKGATTEEVPQARTPATAAATPMRATVSTTETRPRPPMRRRRIERPTPELTTLPIVCPNAITAMAQIGAMASVMIAAIPLMPVSSACMITVGRPSSSAKNMR